MMKRFYLEVVIIFIAFFSGTVKAQNTMNLDNKQQSIVAISALTATGDMDKLKAYLAKGLDAGLTINEIKEVLVQLYAYCGFPRSLNAITAFMTVTKERKENGISDKEGKAATINTNSEDNYERGRKMLETLTKTPQTKPAPGFGEFAPRIDAFLKEHLFADIFESDVLTYQQRELATVSALAAMSGVSSQLQAHVGMAMNTGLTESQLSDCFKVMDQTVGKSQGDLARSVLGKILETKKP